MYIMSGPNFAPSTQNFSQPETAEYDTSSDQLVVQFLSGLAANNGFGEYATQATSSTFNGLRIPREQLESAIATAERAFDIPGVRDTNAGLVEAGDWQTFAHQAREAVLVALMTHEEKAAIAAGIHDAGKAKATIQAVINKPKGQDLTPEDRLVLEDHPIDSERRARAAGITDPLVLFLVGTHHQAIIPDPERNARPYGTFAAPPNERAGWLGQVFAACDYFDARVNVRVYQDNPLAAGAVVDAMPQQLAVPGEVIDLFRARLEIPVAV